MKGQDFRTVGCVCQDAPNVVQVAATSRAPLLVHGFQASQRPRPRPRAFSPSSDAFSARARSSSFQRPILEPPSVSSFDVFRCRPCKRLLEPCNLLFERDDILAGQVHLTRIRLDLLAKVLGLICKLGNELEALLVLALQLVAKLPII